MHSTLSDRTPGKPRSGQLPEGGSFRGLDRLGGSYSALVSPKSKKARCSVEIPSKLADHFRALLASQKVADSPFVFQTEIGEPLDPGAVYDVIQDAQNCAGSRRFGLHGLRHLYSSLLVASGADVKFGQERLGHASAVTTLNIYSHAITSQDSKYVTAVEVALHSVSNLLANSQERNSEGKKPD